MKKIILFALFILNGYYSLAQEKADSVDDEISSIAEVLPEFPGGMAGWAKHLGKNLQYPVIARELNISGKVFIQFVIEKDGSLTDAKVIKGVGGGCDEEALRVVKLSPAWKPGIQNGRPVRVSYVVPITFKVFDEENQPMYVLDGKEISYNELMKIDYKKLQSAERLVVEAAVKKYGEKGKNGVVEVISKKQ